MSRTDAYKLYRLIFWMTRLSMASRFYTKLFLRMSRWDENQIEKLRKWSTCCFKWYLVLKERFENAYNPNIVTDSPAVFKTHLLTSFHSWEDEIWKHTEKQLAHKIDKYKEWIWIDSGLNTFDIKVCTMKNSLGYRIEYSYVNINDKERKSWSDRKFSQILRIYQI